MATKTTKVVTTTTTTTETKTVSGGSSWFGGLSPLFKVLLIIGALLIVGVIVGVLFFGRVKVASNSMETAYAKGSTVWFNRFSAPERGDVLVFRHPEADSVILNASDKNYYKMCRLYGDAWCNKNVDPVVYQGKKKRPIFLSRCIALPGDVVAIKDNKVTVNNNPVADEASTKYLFLTVTNDLLKNEYLEPLGINKSDITYTGEDAETIISFYHNAIPANSQAALYSLSETEADAIYKSNVARKIQRVSLPKEYFERTVFPYVKKVHWNSSNLGPFMVPAKDKLVMLTPNILSIYRRCIEAYEGNKVEVKGNKIFINGTETDSYRFRRNYFFVLGDNRSTEDDSRYFGFLPDNHVMGVVCE
jgi:signal peptidase I